MTKVKSTDTSIEFSSRVIARVLTWFVSAWGLMLLFGIVHIELWQNLPTIGYWTAYAIVLTGSLTAAGFRSMKDTG